MNEFRSSRAILRLQGQALAYIKDAPSLARSKEFRVRSGFIDSDRSTPRKAQAELAVLPVDALANGSYPFQKLKSCVVARQDREKPTDVTRYRTAYLFRHP